VAQGVGPEFKPVLQEKKKKKEKLKRKYIPPYCYSDLYSYYLKIWGRKSPQGTPFMMNCPFELGN
jgi:hypothetical protein